MHVIGRLVASPRMHFHCDGSHRCISNVFGRIHVCVVSMTAGDAYKACLGDAILSRDVLASMARLTGVGRWHALKRAAGPRQLVLQKCAQLAQPLVGEGAD